MEATTGGARLVIGAAELTGAALLERTTTTGELETTGAALLGVLTGTLVTGAALDTGLVRVQGQLVIVKRVA